MADLVDRSTVGREPGDPTPTNVAEILADAASRLARSAGIPPRDAAHQIAQYVADLHGW